MVENINKIKHTHGIAITGNIGCGKSTIINYLKEKSYLCIDADQLSRKIMAPTGRAYEYIVEHFGDKIINLDKTINRQKLGNIVFNDLEQRSYLEKITHPLIQEQLVYEVEHYFKANPKNYWFYEAALIFETNQQKQFYKVILSYCDPKIQFDRLIKRGLNADQINKIRSTQISPKEAINLASWSINNDLTIDQLYIKVEEILSTLQHKRKHHGK